LTLSDLYWTEMACLEPKGIMEQEQAYFRAVNTVASFGMDGDRLELYKEGGTLVLVFAAEGTAAVTPGVADEASTLTAALEAPESLPTGAVVTVEFTLTNVSPEGLYVLTWFTPLEGLAGDIFGVQRDREEVPYRGKLVKRGPPTSEDYVWIDAGGSISAEVDLAQGYDFARAGQYTVQFRSPRLSHIAQTPGDQAETFDELGTIRIPSDPVRLTVERSSG
jgi:hypothetical protein